jgi:O-antigen/teichoic acid export membrane protein
MTGISTCLLAVMLTRSLIGRPTLDTVGLLLRSGALLLPTLMASWMLQVVDRLFLVKYISTTELGYYAMANKMASLLSVAMSPIYSAWMPLALAKQHDLDAKQQLAAMARYLVVGALSGSLGLGLFATEILIVLTRAPYLPAAPYVGLLTYVHVFTAISVSLTICGLIDKRLTAISGAVGGGAIINLGLNFWLIPQYGLWGATLATVVGYAVPVALLYWRIRARLPQNYPIRPIVFAMLAQLALLGLGLLVPPLKFPLRVGLKMAIFCLLPVSFVGLGMLTRSEIRQGWLFARHRLNQLLARLLAKQK